MQQNGRVTGAVGRPAYQQVADDLRRQIAAGELVVGSAIPSTARLSKLYRVSVTVVRAAVAQLRADGLVVGHPGKGVFVSSTPMAVAERATSMDDLARQVAELRAELHGADAVRRDELAAQIRELRGSVESIRERLIDLYAELGKPRPDDLVARPDAERPAPGDARH